MIKIMRKKVLVMLMTLAMVICMLPALTIFANAQTISLVQDASSANPPYLDAGHSFTTDYMASSLDNEGGGTIVSNYVGNVTWGGANSDWVNQAALKFTLPATSSVLSTATLHLPVVDIKGMATATVTLTDDNYWQQTNDSTTSAYPSLSNAKTLLIERLITSTDNVPLPLDTTALAAKISSSGTTDITLILTGNTDTDNYFNFVADDDASSDQAYLELTFKPQVQSVSVPSNGTYKIGDALNFSVAFDSVVIITGSPRIPITLNNGGTVYASYVSGSNSNNLVFRYTVSSGVSDADGITLESAIDLNGGTIKNANFDSAELNLYSVAATTGVLIDGVAPTISNVLAPRNATYIPGQNLDYTVNFNEAVNVVIAGGTPYLTLTVGSSTVHAAYYSGSGGTAITFRYTVVAGDADADGVALSANATLNGGTIKDAVGNNATLTFTGGTAAGVLVSSAPIVTDANISISGASGTDGTYKIGDTVTATWDNTATGDNQSDITGVTMDFNQFGGGTAVAANNTSGKWIATYTISASSISGTNKNVSVSVTNNSENTTTTADTTNATVDAIAPAVTNVSSTNANGTYGIGDTITITVSFNENVTVTGKPQLTLETDGVNRNVDYSSGSGTSELTFNYIVQGGDVSHDLDYTTTNALSLNDGTIRDAVGNDAILTLPVPGAANSLGANNAIVINALPTISINDTSVIEGNAGTSMLTFTVTLSAASSKTITMEYATAEGTAISGSDYIAMSGTLTFAPGETSKTVSIFVNGDTSAEPDETLLFNISTPINATISDAQGTGTILNDDASPETQPTATFTATGPDTGTLSGVTSGMKYQIDGGIWTDITSGADINLADLSACTISVVKKGNGTTTTDSSTQTIMITKAATPTTVGKVDCTAANYGKLTGVTVFMEYKPSAAPEWLWFSGNGSDITGLESGTYHVRVKATGTVLASDNQIITIAAYSAPPYSGGGGSYTPSAPVTEIKNGESTTGSNVDLLISSEKTLTVIGNNGAKLVFDTDALKGIDSQTADSIHVEIKDVSPTHQDDRPDKLVFSLTVSSGGNTISNFAGSVTVSLPYSLKDEESADKVTVWHLANDGTMTEIPSTYDPVTGLATFTVTHFSLYVVGVPDAQPWINPFTDVSEDDWFYNAVEFTSSNNLFAGTDATTFSPNDPMTRAMLWTVLGRLDGQSLSGSDVYDNARDWAMSAGITDGTDPDDNITREQMVTILWRYTGSPKSNGDMSMFSDKDSVASYAVDAMSWAVENGIIAGANGALIPKDNATRAQVAAILHRFIEGTMN